MVLEGLDRLLGHRVHGVRADQLLDVEHVAVGGVLRRGRGPEAALRPGALAARGTPSARRRTPPASARRRASRSRPRACPRGRCGRAPRDACRSRCRRARRRSWRPSAPSRDRRRRRRGARARGGTPRRPRGSGQGEDQRHVDRAPCAMESSIAAEARLGRRDLHVEVRAVDPRVEAHRLGERAPRGRRRASGRPPATRSRRARPSAPRPAAAGRTRRGCPRARARRRSRACRRSPAPPSAAARRKPAWAIAFWKIVGFEVTPMTASSAISRASSPVSSISRERESIQTLTPCSLSSCSLDVAIRCIRISIFSRRRAARAPRPSPTVPDTAPRRRSAPRGSAHELAGERRADDLGAEAEHVHVVVLDALVRGVAVVADRGADAADLRGGDRGAGARAADEDAALGASAHDRPADRLRDVRVVDPGLLRVGAEVDRLVTGGRDRGEDHIPQADAAVVEPERDLHLTSDAAPPRRPRRP